LMPGEIHDTSQYANNRAEQLQEVTRVRERGIQPVTGTGSMKYLNLTGCLNASGGLICHHC